MRKIITIWSLIAFTSGCAANVADGAGTADSGRVRVVVESVAEQAEVKGIRCTIEVSESERPIVHSLGRDGDYFAGLFSGIPAGAERRIIAEALDDSQAVLSRAETRVTVRSGELVSVFFTLGRVGERNQTAGQRSADGLVQSGTAAGGTGEGLAVDRVESRSEGEDSGQSGSGDDAREHPAERLVALPPVEHTPSISWTYVSGDQVEAGGQLEFLVTVAEEDAGGASYGWSDDCGGNGFQPANAPSAIWTAPLTGAACLVECEIALRTGVSLKAGFSVMVSSPVAPGPIAVTPSSAMTSETVEISGTGFLNRAEWNQVWFGDIAVEPLQVAGDRLVARVPEDLPGKQVQVRVQTAGGLSEPVSFTNLGNRVYVLHLGGLAVVDTINREVVGGQEIDTVGSHLVLSADGRTLFQTHFLSAMVSAIDTASLSVLAEIAVGEHPNSIALSPDGNAVYVPNFDSNTMSVIDVRAGSDSRFEVIGTIPTGDGPVMVHFTPAGDRALVPALRSADLTEIDTDPESDSYLEALATIDLPFGRPSDISFRGQTALVANQKHAQSVSVVDIDPLSPTYRQVLQDYRFDGWPVMTRLIPGTDQMFVSVFDSARDSSFLARFDLSLGLAAPETVPLQKGGFSLTLSPAAGEVFVTTAPTWDYETGEIVFVGADPQAESFSEVTAVLQTEGFPEDIRILPGNEEAAVAAGASDQLLFVDLRQHQVTATVEVGSYPFGLAATP